MNWNILIHICDILACVGTVVTLNLVEKHYKVWLWYSFFGIMYITVTAYNKIPGLTIMGIILLFTGIRNYYIGRKKNHE